MWPIQSYWNEEIVSQRSISKWITKMIAPNKIYRAKSIHKILISVSHDSNHMMNWATWINKYINIHERSLSTATTTDVLEILVSTRWWFSGGDPFVYHPLLHNIDRLSNWFGYESSSKSANKNRRIQNDGSSSRSRSRSSRG